MGKNHNDLKLFNRDVINDFDFFICTLSIYIYKKCSNKWYVS